MIDFRKRHPVFRRRRFSTATEMAWYRPDGERMTGEDWSSGFGKAVGVTARRRGDHRDRRPRRAGSATTRSCSSSTPTSSRWSSACPDAGERWVRVLDTADAFNEGDTPAAGEPRPIEARSIAVFRRTA